MAGKWEVIGGAAWGATNGPWPLAVTPVGDRPARGIAVQRAISESLSPAATSFRTATTSSWERIVSRCRTYVRNLSQRPDGRNAQP